ncbi:sel1 repeat family protein [Thalassotalea sp. LPB0316]|uniref:tetratricopeptide repeat protein n=1 Tax=Thalassotalea sp. LPB0316 TaxID=2769490 RepID=UPI0018690532|nr:tetratricopeptide repeat protein [Thalassotalea sp. LPB0316]QOL24545.1 sel1 repeat family protein [Thalassotalea sp. LPB0316]
MKKVLSIFALAGAFLLAPSTKAEQIEPCQTDECVEYFKQFKKGAKRGHLQAYATLGQFYYVGYGTEIDEDKALKYLNKAARKGEQSSQYLVGAISLISDENKDLDKAVKYLEKVAKSNYKDSNFLLGTLYVNDKYLPRDFEKADFYLAKAYKQRDPRMPELLTSVADDLEKHKASFPLLTKQMNKKPMLKTDGEAFEWPKTNIEVITINSPPLTTRFDEQIVTFKKRKKTTGSKFQGSTCDEQVSCYQVKLNGQSVDTFFNVTSAFSYSN